MKSIQELGVEPKLEEAEEVAAIAGGGGINVDCREICEALSLFEPPNQRRTVL
jgi:hypothetical protein